MIQNLCLYLRLDRSVDKIIQEEGVFLKKTGVGWPGVTKPMICHFNVEPGKHRPRLNEKDWYFTMGDILGIY